LGDGLNSLIFLIETIYQDLRYALRLLRRSLGFAAVAILSLGLGIGANTAIYSVIHGVLLRPLPYPEPDRLVRVEQIGSQGQLSMPEFEFWRDNNRSFVSTAGHRGTSDQLLSTGNNNVWIQTMPVTTDFFRTLGVTPGSGRELEPAETRADGPQAVILSNALWRNTFGSDTKAIGRMVTIDNVSYTVVGVLPPGFWFPESADAYLPLRSTGSASDSGANTEMFARLKPAVQPAQAREEMRLLSDRYQNVATDAEKPYRGLTIHGYQDFLLGDVRTNLLLLFGAVGLLLLIACFNLAGLLLARLAARQKEIAMRVALGGSRSRLLCQFLMENMVLTVFGGLAGLIGAQASLSTLLASIPFELPASSPIKVDTAVLGFTILVCMLIGTAFSLAPTLMASRLRLHDALKTGGQSGNAPLRQRTRSLLVVGEVALSVTLLVGAGLLIQSLYRMTRERLGFDPHGVMTFSTRRTAEQGRKPLSVRIFNDSLLPRLKNLPGVHNAAGVNFLPLTEQSNYPTEREGHPDQDIGGMEIRVVTPAYFATMSIPIVRGRSFDAGDIAGSTAVILVNETVARQWWDKGSPLGDHVVVGRFKGRELFGDKPREVIGVVADTKSVYLKAPPKPTVYLPATQPPWDDSTMNWVVQGRFSEGFVEQVRRAVADVDPRRQVERVRSMDDIVASTKAESRFNALLFGAFAGLAALLAALGVYGLLSFSVARRGNEIGTRIALGASRAAVLKLILKQGISLVLIGLVPGLIGAFFVSRTLESLLFGVRSTDPASFIGVALLMVAVGLLASYFPARRATRIDPLAALRSE
jgi:predicted permease